MMDVTTWFFGQEIIDAGFSDEIVRRATGHKSLEAYQQYIKLDPSVVMNLVKNPKLDTDNDGMFDQWEIENGFDLNDSSDCPSWFCGPNSNGWRSILYQKQP